MQRRYKYLFGPVLSRRLGLSLGIDLVPAKVCSLNCVYCECGRTTKLTLERKEYVPTLDVLAELDDFFKNSPHLDYVTFSGAGEPTLHSKIGEIIQYLKQHYPSVPVAVLTNATLFREPDVVNALLLANLVKASLDAATELTFLKVNRPASGLKLAQLLEGLLTFRRQYKGHFLLEVFIVPGLNDSPEEISALRNWLTQIRPDRIQLNTLDRPGTVDTLHPASQAELLKIQNLLNLPNLEIIPAPAPAENNSSYRADIAMAIVETISRRPCTIQDLASTLGVPKEQIETQLGLLKKRYPIERKELNRGIFYKIRE